ncbi:fimbrial assembly protein [Bradyrhizobium sp. LTSPM299]|uniref:PilN domain-containing protein n=1 Tax=Bradyrhizobium sp. LTSPM299 TaxID=1619233 RepID=UPI0005C8082D|nr:PilN domain-containing protein [Bradyrhizobium sp. LTSPM299]KJC56709.1 fimbrial assembly protein [Bradyrhizobium sp. LTSPM299]
MALISDAKQFLAGWIDAVSRAVDTVAGRFMRAQQIRLVEADDGALTASLIAAKGGTGLSDVSFRLDSGKPQPSLSAEWNAALRGGRIEVLLQPAHVMTHPLDFPSKAADFLDGMIRAQVDRLTPWSVDDAVFGWSSPVSVANDRIDVIIAATSKLKIAPVIAFAEKVDAASVAILAPADASAPIKLIDKPLRSVVGAAVNVPRLLRAILLSTALAAAASLLTGAYFGGSLQSELGDLQQRISQRRASLRLGANGSVSGLGLLAKRKQTTPSSVMVLEAISKALPDSTYITELRIEGDKVQVAGMTQDAPSLVRLMEQSPQFTRVTFFAPTTHATNEPGERFHIEAHLTAYFGSGT